MKNRTLATALVAVLALAGCASAEPKSAPGDADASASASTSTENADLNICAEYAPTSNGDLGPVAQQVTDLYLSAEATPETVNPLFYTVKDLEHDAQDAALKAAVAEYNTPVYNMKDAIDSGGGSFTNQWDAMTAATKLLQACTDLGYSVD